jgi:hypothetical protein
MPLATGANGGGVFDERGRLIGIVTMNAPRAGLAPNANFVLPSQWIAETPERAGKQLSAAAAPAAVAAAKTSPGAAVLAPGMTWTYRWRDRTYDRDRVFSVRTTAVDNSNVTEVFSSGADQQTFVANPKEIGFQTRRISGDPFVELSPYLLARVPAPAMPLPQTPRGYAAAGDGNDWSVKVQRVRREEVTVPAGRFDAYRVTVTGENALLAFAYQSGPSSAGNDYRVMRFEYDAWYAPEISRYVQIRHKTYGRQGKDLGDEWVQLTKFQPDAAPPK